MKEQQQIIEAYKRKVAIRNTLIVIGCVLLLGVSLIVSMDTGYIKMSPSDVLRTLFGRGTDKEKLILFDFRLPRIVISMLVGAGLALSGCIIQSVSKNPLADPGILGINAGASLMVILYVLVFSAESFLSVFTLPFLALIGAGITAVIVYIFSYKRDEGISTMRLVLTGVAVQAGISALTTLLVVKLDDTQYNFVVAWQAGSIWGSNWKFVMTLLPWLLILIPYILSKSSVMDILTLSDDIAYGLGASVKKERRKLLAAAVALAASCVAVSGSISFVGLIAPHLSRRLVGPRHGVLLSTSILIGAVLVSLADTIGRVIIQPSEIPTGIVVAIIGAPYFLYLLSNSKS
ncbi:iron ABC transporter permease [Clostridium sporogenes]|uniref:ABC-type Fe3+-siderophore transport system, permease component n=1 Tax=Clostridium sporogenes TaxID=1509 RepID=A0A7X5SXU1_CLOSG|nr:iron ABC transporter permease [Clostridium sporogenes]AJD31950.1 fecCD transport family protein [Clostridium botulinum Prevot_594]AVP61399.1 iron ABC transporter permease [Clostridium botulinum]AKC61432.1 ABC-type Fe3+-siderophore transport system, permease component [Clostridium sporogenes]AKJ88763.1 iron ABC transporter permease [Clostridium sporogenes]EHN15280.1 ferrichrome ABC transporter, permease protein FhuG [Clostridium sporogenes PA 3679]